MKPKYDNSSWINFLQNLDIVKNHDEILSTAFKTTFNANQALLRGDIDTLTSLFYKAKNRASFFKKLAIKKYDIYKETFKQLEVYDKLCSYFIICYAPIVIMTGLLYLLHIINNINGFLLLTVIFLGFFIPYLFYLIIFVYRSVISSYYMKKSTYWGHSFRIIKKLLKNLEENFNYEI